jgi:hypothetical protein
MTPNMSRLVERQGAFYHLKDHIDNPPPQPGRSVVDGAGYGPCLLTSFSSVLEQNVALAKRSAGKTGVNFLDYFISPGLGMFMASNCVLWVKAQTLATWWPGRRLPNRPPAFIEIRELYEEEIEKCPV